MNRSARLFVVLALAALVLIAAALRLTDINWDRYQHLHPDERFIVWVADTMRWPSDIPGGFLAQARVALDPARSALNPLRWPLGGENSGEPRNFAYGHFPLYLLIGVAHVAAAVGGWFGETSIAFPAWMTPLYTVGRHLAEYNYLSLVGRAISTAADLGTLLLVYALGCRVGRRLDLTGFENLSGLGRATGLLAAAAYAFAVLPIQLSHFSAVDPLLTFFVVATVALAARFAEQGGRWAWLLAGVTAGLAVGSKFSAVMVALPLLAAALFRLPDGPWGRKALAVLRRVLAVGLVAVVTFVVTNPFAVIEFNSYVYQIYAQNQMVSGRMDAPYTRQYIGTIPYWYFIQQLGQWGLGWPLGLLAWAGLGWALVRFALGRFSPALAVMLAWAFPYFLVTGLFHTKFLRYMAPLLPFLLVFGAAFAVSALGWLRRRFGRAGQWAWDAAAVVTALVTVLWSIAFVNVYRQEHPWIVASAWIYENVPDGAKVLSEAWDDALPLALDEIPGRPPARNYKRAELPVWDTDSAAKLRQLATELASADYLAIASNRIYAPMSRLAWRYPMTSEYYRQLFGGELGYEQVAELSAYPRLGAGVIRDDHADESFSVYDHPRAIIFRNTGRLSADEITERLALYLPPGADVESAARPTTHKIAGHASLARQDAPPEPLLLSQPVDTLPDVTDYRWNRFASDSPLVAILLWWFVITLFGWLAWPLLFPLLRGLPDRGHALSRAAGWLLLGWIHWMGVSLGLWRNALGPLLLILLALVLLGRVAWTAQRGQMREFIAQRRRLLIGQEALFLVAFLLFVLVRLLNPDLWQPWNGGEKFMEFAFLNATLRSPVFPPYDPYFAGGIINYYYYGLYLVGLPIRLTGIFAEVAFNLAVPSLFALTALGAWSIGHAIGSRAKGVRPAVVGGLAALLTVLLGNLTGVEWAVKGLADVLRGGGFPLFDYWAASRVVPYTINEFPLWTFTFADLHPHLISMPFGLLTAGLALNWIVNRPVTWRQWLLNILLIALSLGALGAINTWDLPTYALLIAGAMLLAAWRAPGEGRGRALVAAAITAFGALILSVLAYLPFYRNYQAQVGGGEGNVVARFLGLVKDPSPAGKWLLIWGFFLFVAVSYTAMMLLRRGLSAERDAGHERRGPRAWLFVALALVGLLAVLAALGRPTVALAALPLLLALPLIVDRRADPGSAFAALLLALGLAVVAGIEVVYLRDFLEGGDWYRMNTLFKFSVPAWLFLGLASSYMLARLWRVTCAAPAWLGVPWQAAAGVLLVGSLVFLFVGVRARTEDRFPNGSPPLGALDVTAYMDVAEYTWPNANHTIRLANERAALKWLLDNVSGAPVVAEAPAGTYIVDGEQVGYDYYRAGGLRVASITGLPTFLGQHQYEQRPGEQIAPRSDDAHAFFASTDIAETQRLMADLRVGYIYIGQLERLLFDAASLRKFDVLAEAGELRIAYRNDDVTIYEVAANDAN